MIELLLLMMITPSGEPYIECPAGCYPHTNLDLWAEWVEVKNYNPSQGYITFRNQDIPIYTTAQGLIDFKFVFRWLQ